MKRTLTFAAIAILSCAAFNGCYKQTQYINSIGATIDSIGFTASGTTQVSFYADTSTHNPTMVDVSGQTTIYTPGTTTQPSIKLIIPNVAGSYSIPSQAKATVVTSATGSGGTAATSGQIVVLSTTSGRLQGNFTFTCADGTKVTNGQFTGIVGYP